MMFYNSGPFFQPVPSPCFFHCLFLNSALMSATDGAARIFLPPNAGVWFKPTSVELYRTGRFEGRSTDWATAPWPKSSPWWNSNLVRCYRKRRLSKKKSESSVSVTGSSPTKNLGVQKLRAEKSSKVTEKKSERKKVSGKSLCDLHFKCSYCSVAFVRKDSLQSHLRQHLKQQQQQQQQQQQPSSSRLVFCP